MAKWAMQSSPESHVTLVDNVPLLLALTLTFLFWLIPVFDGLTCAQFDSVYCGFALLYTGNGQGPSHRAEESCQCVPPHHQGNFGGEDHGVNSLTVPLNTPNYLYLKLQPHPTLSSAK